MGDDELRGDLREIREGLAALVQKVSTVGNGLHEHLNQIEKDPWWHPPAKGLAWALVFILGVGSAGWLAKESLLPEGYLERFLDALLAAVERTG